MRTKVSHSIKETEDLAKEWLETVSTQKYGGDFDGTADESVTKSALVVGLSGHLGSGKTAFTQAVAQSLGIKEVVTSPTFVIMKKYEIPEDSKYHIKNGGMFNRLVHIDAYRLESGRDLIALDFEREVEDPTSLILIEWPEKIQDGLPSGITMIKFEHISENERSVEFS